MRRRSSGQEAGEAAAAAAMSRLYEPPCLRRTKAAVVHSERLDGGGRWDPGAWQRGDGVIVEGELLDVSRHLIWDVSGRKERYFVLYIKPRTIHRRKFDPKGNEVEPNFSETRKVSTGFLPASYRVETKGPTDRLSLEELERLVAVPELEKMTRPYASSQTVAFWLPESEMLELETGTSIRLRTLGDGPFVFSLAKLEAGTVTKCNFSGDRQAGASWTESILACKDRGDPSEAPREDGDGANEDEWED